MFHTYLLFPLLTYVFHIWVKSAHLRKLKIIKIKEIKKKCSMVCQKPKYL